MKVFLDTNIFVEYIYEREQFASVQRIFKAIKNKQIDGITSHATFYTLAYLSDQMLKHKGIHRPELTEQTRGIVRSMLQLVPVGNMDYADMITGVDDTTFSDIEDSFQYQCALRNRCDYLVTINIKDFPNVPQTLMEILTPNDFVAKVL
jgi:predicted nucleic acid-binding protein